jgi:hypothetical protein
MIGATYARGEAGQSRAASPVVGVSASLTTSLCVAD